MSARVIGIARMATRNTLRVRMRDADGADTGDVVLRCDRDDAPTQTSSDPMGRTSDDHKYHGPSAHSSDVAPMTEINAGRHRILLRMRVPFADVIECLVGFTPPTQRYALMVDGMTEEPEAALNITARREGSFGNVG